VYYYYYYDQHHHHHHLLSQVLFLPWYFSSWASGEPHDSGFKSQLVALSLWCVMFLLWKFFVGNLLRVILVLFPDIFVNVCLQFRWPQWLLVWPRISCPTFSEFLYLDLYTLISFQLPFVLHSYLIIIIIYIILGMAYIVKCKICVCVCVCMYHDEWSLLAIVCHVSYTCPCIFTHGHP
jgi:hypothetical protein